MFKKLNFNKKPVSFKNQMLDTLKIKMKGVKKYFISTGVDLLNLILTGDINKGLCTGRIYNVIGDSSTGKTIQCIEVCNATYYIEYLEKKKKVAICYDESEDAFDYDLAQRLGMPLDFIDFVCTKTVEAFHAKVREYLLNHQGYDIILYIKDSLDTMSDEAERKVVDKNLAKMLKREAKKEKSKLEKADENETKAEESSNGDDGKLKGSFGAAKAKYLSTFFRTETDLIAQSNCILLIVSQVRDNIGVMYGNKLTRSGGRALDFYCSAIYWLKKIEEIVTPKFKLATGIVTEARVRKNKLWKPFRRVGFDIIFDYGIDNIGSLIDFCAENNYIKESRQRFEWKGKNYKREDLINLFETEDEEFQELKQLTQKLWNDREAETTMNRKPKWS